MYVRCKLSVAGILIPKTMNNCLKSVCLIPRPLLLRRCQSSEYPVSILSWLLFNRTKRAKFDCHLWSSLLNNSNVSQAAVFLPYLSTNYLSDLTTAPSGQLLKYADCVVFCQQTVRQYEFTYLFRSLEMCVVPQSVFLSVFSILIHLISLSTPLRTDL